MVPHAAHVAMIAERLAAVRQRIVAAGGSDVEIVAVTKAHPAAVIDEAIAAGCDMIGENYAQELVDKLAGRSSRPRVHFIGQLQTNKVRLISSLVDVYETVDRPSLVGELAKRVPGAEVLVQVDATGEPGKGGCPLGDVETLCASAAAAGLRVDGLMTVGPTHGGPQAAAPVFRTVRALCDRLGLRTLSMGMSDDFEVAVAQGATRVRLGSALFGARPPESARVR